MADEATPRAGRAAGAIHDIGYRRYDGPRLGRAHVCLALLHDTLRAGYGLGRTTRSKVAPFLLLAAICLPTLVWVVVGAILHLPELPVDFTEYLMVVQVLITIFAAVFAPGAVSRDLRFRTMPLYRSRPMTAGDYVAAKLLAGTAALLLLMLAPMLILFLGGLLAEIPFREELPDFLRGLCAALLLAPLLAAIALLVAALTPRRGIGIAAIVTILLVLAGSQVVVLAVAEEIGNDALATWSRLLSPYLLVDGIVAGVLGGSTYFPGEPDTTVESLGFVAAWLALVAALTTLLLLRYRRETGA